MDFEIIHNAGHYDVYLEGEFHCTADSYSEAVDEVEKCFEKVEVEGVIMD